MKQTANAGMVLAYAMSLYSQQFVTIARDNVPYNRHQSLKQKKETENEWNDKRYEWNGK